VYQEPFEDTIDLADFDKNLLLPAHQQQQQHEQHAGSHMPMGLLGDSFNALKQSANLQVGTFTESYLLWL
jgi:hypothetical protein